MKRQNSLKMILTSGCLLLSFILQAEVSKTINVTTAGTLPSKILSSEKFKITNLTLTGNLNGTDFGYIREMAGSDYSGMATEGQLSILDLSGANIVEGGNFPFWISNPNENNKIWKGLFIKCTRLTSIILPNSITSIGSESFSECSGLTSITIPNSVTSIDGYVFYSCTGLTSVTIGNGITSIAGELFSSCTGLTSAIIVDGSTCVFDYLFSNCTNLTSVTIPNSVTSIGKSAFQNCSGLTSLTIPNTITSISESAFSGCSGLTSIIIPNNITSIGNNAFSGCCGITSITIPNSITSISDGAFSGCSGLTSITIPNSVTSIGSGAFYNCIGLKSVTIGSEVTIIRGQAFENCTGLTSVIIPNGIDSIGIQSFYNCSNLTTITLPTSLKSIDLQAFYNCSGLTSIISANPEPPKALENSFEGVGGKKCKIYVPVGSKQKYEEAIGWEKFSTIVESSDLGDVSVTLTISMSVSGGIELKLAKGDIFTGKIVPSAGWKVNTITLNGSDITSQLDILNQYTTPPITENSTLSVSFESTNTPVAQTQSDNIMVYSDGESIVINGAEPGEQISVYTEAGAFVQSTTATGNVVRIDVPAGHVYLIKTVGRIFKIVL